MDSKTIIAGVEEGRRIFENLKKSISYVLSANTVELSPFLLSILLDMPLALTIVLVLAIDLGTDLGPALSLAYEEKERDIMNQPPRYA